MNNHEMFGEDGFEWEKENENGLKSFKEK